MAQRKTNKQVPKPDLGQFQQLAMTVQVLREERDRLFMVNQSLLQKLSNTQKLLAALVWQEWGGEVTVGATSIDEMDNPDYTSGVRYTDRKKPKGIKIEVVRERVPNQEEGRQ